MVLVVMNPPANAEDIRDVGFIPRLGRSHGRGRGNLLQFSCLDRDKIKQFTQEKREKGLLEAKA